MVRDDKMDVMPDCVSYKGNIILNGAISIVIVCEIDNPLARSFGFLTTLANGVHYI